MTMVASTCWRCRAIARRAKGISDRSGSRLVQNPRALFQARSSTLPPTASLPPREAQPSLPHFPIPTASTIESSICGTFHSQQYVYGTAINRAAVIEKEDAHGPLILLAPDVYEDVIAVGPRLLPWIEADGPDRHFVHYLVQYAHYHRQPRLPGTVSLDVDAERIAFYISRRILKDSGRVLAKAEWFQAYWNRTVARADGCPRIEANPTLTEPDGPRTTIVKRLVASRG